jgi:hypothetical protein
VIVAAAVQHKDIVPAYGLAMGTSTTNRSTPPWFCMHSAPRQWAKVTSAQEEPLLWNLMWLIAGAPDGSFYFDNQPNMLDQLFVNKSMAIGNTAIKVNPPWRSSGCRSWSIQGSTRSRSRRRNGHADHNGPPITSQSP